MNTTQQQGTQQQGGNQSQGTGASDQLWIFLGWLCLATVSLLVLWCIKALVDMLLTIELKEVAKTATENPMAIVSILVMAIAVVIVGSIAWRVAISRGLCKPFGLWKKRAGGGSYSHAGSEGRALSGVRMLGGIALVGLLCWWLLESVMTKQAERGRLMSQHVNWASFVQQPSQSAVPVVTRNQYDLAMVHFVTNIVLHADSASSPIQVHAHEAISWGPSQVLKDFRVFENGLPINHRVNRRRATPTATYTFQAKENGPGTNATLEIWVATGIPNGS